MLKQTHKTFNRQRKAYRFSTLLKMSVDCSISVQVGVCWQGQHGVEQEVFLSLPCVLGRGGVADVVRQPLTEEEQARLQHSAKLMHEVQNGIHF